MIDGRAFSRTAFEQLRSAESGQDQVVRRMELVAHLLDSVFMVPVINKRVGIDAIIGLVPGIGDLFTTLLSSYVIWEARNLGVSRLALCRMLGNLTIHASIGSIPLIGDIFSALFRVNERNMRIVRAQLATGKNSRSAAQTTITIP